MQAPEIKKIERLHPVIYVQDVQGQSVFFNLALRERNIQVRLYRDFLKSLWIIFEGSIEILRFGNFDYYNQFSKK